MPNRRSIRLDGYDYATDGSYFITICTQHKEHRFGHIANNNMVLNEAGQMVEERIIAIPATFPGTLIDSYVVMPNHVHMIVSIVGAAHRGRPLSDTSVAAGTPSELKNVPGMDVPGMDVPGMDVPGMDVPGMDVPDQITINQYSGPFGPKAGGHDEPPLHGTPLSAIIGWFKASVTNYYIKGVKAGMYPAFDRRLWQRNYYEHIIRTDAAYNHIDEYIRTNPERWAEDRLR